MNLNSRDLMYELHTKELSHTETLKQYTDHVVKEIKLTYGWDTDIHINIEPKVKDKHIFSVSMTVYGLGQPIIVKKDGKHVLPILRKVKKAVIRQIHRLSTKRIARRRKLPHYERQDIAS